MSKPVDLDTYRRVQDLVKQEVAKVPAALAAGDNGDGTFNGVKVFASLTGLSEAAVAATFARAKAKKGGPGPGAAP
jgi:hypothetical protein